MINLGVNVAVIEDGRVLLTQRADFEVWCLPGGQVESGESLAQAAVREVREETGLHLQLLQLVGIYSRPLGMGQGYHIVVFVARPVGGSPLPQPGEVIAMDYFPAGALPPLLWGQRQRIEDAFASVTGVARMQEIPHDLAQLTREDVFGMRDRSGLPRAKFYAQVMEQFGPENQQIEVPGVTRLEP